MSAITAHDISIVNASSCTINNNMCVYALKKIVHIADKESTRQQLRTVSQILTLYSQSQGNSLSIRSSYIIRKIVRNRRKYIKHREHLLKVLCYLTAQSTSLSSVFLRTCLRILQILRVRTYCNRTLQLCSRVPARQRLREVASSPLSNLTYKHTVYSYKTRKPWHTKKKKNARSTRKMLYTFYERCLFNVNELAYQGNMQYKNTQKRKIRKKQDKSNSEQGSVQSTCSDIYYVKKLS